MKDFNTKKEVILTYLKENNMTLQEFSRLCGVSVQTLNRVMSKKSEARYSTIVKICKVTGNANKFLGLK